jgi:hypothetical protein
MRSSAFRPIGTQTPAPHFVPLSENEAEHEPKRLSRSGGLAHLGLVSGRLTLGLEFKQIAPLRIRRRVPDPSVCIRLVRRNAESLQETFKVVVGSHVLLPRSFFSGDIPRRLLQRVSLAKPTSAPWRF